MTQKPFVSICVPNYNKGKYIGETIQSILDQTHTNFELIVIDNASTDNSMEVINSFNDPRMRVYRNDRNIGATANTNKCYDYAKGDYIVVFHSDDLFPKWIVELEVTVLSSFEYLGIASTGYTSDISVFRNQEKAKEIQLYHQWDFLNYLFSGRTLCIPSIMVTRACYDEFGSYNTDLYEGADQILYLLMASKYGLALIEDLKVYKRPWPRKATLNDMKLWIHAYELLKATANDIYVASTQKKKLKTFYTFFIAIQDRNICRRSLLMGDYKRARKHLLLYMRNKLKITKDEDVIKWIKLIDDTPQ